MFVTYLMYLAQSSADNPKIVHSPKNIFTYAMDWSPGYTVTERKKKKRVEQNVVNIPLFKEGEKEYKDIYIFAFFFFLV